MLTAHTIDRNPPLHSFIKLHLGGAGPDPAEAEAAALRVELADLQQKCNLLMEENKELQDKVRCRLDLQISRGFERVSTVTYNLHLIIIFQLLQYEPSPEEEVAE